MTKVTLNEAQREAVDHIYGPLLVLAGPGTGKTQLLSARIANILNKTDAGAKNILCLTFTENAAHNMRERLASLIQDDAYDVHIDTYHGFSSFIIKNYPQYFESIDLETDQDLRLETPIDELKRIEIVSEILTKLPYSSPLALARYYIKDVVSTIGDLKKGLYTPESLRILAQENLKDIEAVSPQANSILASAGRMPSTLAKSSALLLPLAKVLKNGGALSAVAHNEFEVAMAEAEASGKSTPLSQWKSKWFNKDRDGDIVFSDEQLQYKILELADVYESYQKRLAHEHLYDFEDMILKSIEAITSNDDLKYTLQEQYQFILLDEFQDTNASQFKLVSLLADNPVNEGQPNIFAVGDDDQAIYAFQGADQSNMLTFVKSFRDVKVINLHQNYRSHPDILHAAHNISEQIESRLHHNLENISKTLTASASELPPDAEVERHEFSAEADELHWVASKIEELCKNGERPSDIVILAPRHKYLENSVPFLLNKRLPISYEKREDILSTPLVVATKLMVELVCACAYGDIDAMNALFPRVLSEPFYELPVKTIWSINWQLRREGEHSWAELALDYEALASHVLFYLGLGLKLESEPLEYILDYLSGICTFTIDEDTEYTSPLKEYFFTDATRNALQFYEYISHLSIIREQLRNWQLGKDRMLLANDFLAFIKAYEAAEQPLLNSHPVALASDSVQLMTVYKAKGLEFKHVFLLSVHDDVWGKSARSNFNKLALPENLKHIRHQAGGEDDLKRLLYVAITRAKQGLYLTSHTTKENGKTNEPVKYLQESEGVVKVLKGKAQTVVRQDTVTNDTLEHVKTMWYSRHLQPESSLKELLKDRLDTYQMNPTHLNNFIDLEHCGPEEFVVQTLLRFPKAPTPDGEYGTAIHYALEQHQLRLSAGKQATIAQAVADFKTTIHKRFMPEQLKVQLLERGSQALTRYIDARSQMFSLTAATEVSFIREGVVLGNAKLSGKIDRIEIDEAKKELHIVDYKTGRPFSRWENEVKLLKYRQQLCFYKFLVEGSHTWSNYKIASARLEFIEADGYRQIVDPLYIEFSDKEVKQTKELISAIWELIMKLDLPNTQKYSKDYAGVMKFIKDLVEV